MRSAYHELQISSRKRESLEWSARTKMETDMGKLKEDCKQLQGKIILDLKGYQIDILP